MESGKLTKKVVCRLRALVLSLCAVVTVTGFADSALAQNNQGKSVSGTSDNPRITVKGRITDDHDEPLPGANVLSRVHRSELPLMRTEIIHSHSEEVPASRTS